MKISGSAMAMVSDAQAEELGMTMEQKAQTRTVRQAEVRLQELQGVPQVIVDRISISRERTEEHQSLYSFSLAARSAVAVLETGETVTHDMTSTMERLVGGVIDKEVIINSIQENRDIRLSGSTDAPLPGSSPRLEAIGGTSISAREIALRKIELYFEAETVKFTSSGEVTTEDGRIISFSLELALDRAFMSRTEDQALVRQWQERVNLTDPLVISLDGKAPRLTDATFQFDLNNDGKKENISFPSSGSGFLSFDRNGDRVINDGSELFGPGTGNGFEELRVYDEDGNGWIDETDSVFSQLSVWTKDEKGEDRLISLKDAGIGAIALQYAATGFDMTQADNQLQGRLKNTGVFLFENGQVGLVQEMDLVSRTEDAMPLADQTTPWPDLRIPIPSGFPALPSVPAIPQAAEPEEPKNPFKDLLEQVKKLKEEWARLYEKNESPPVQSTFRGDRSGYYEALNLKMSPFLYHRKA